MNIELAITIVILAVVMITIIVRRRNKKDFEKPAMSPAENQKARKDWRLFKEAYLPNLRHQFTLDHAEYEDFREEIVKTLREFVESEEAFDLWKTGSEKFTSKMNELTHLTYSRLYDARELEIEKKVEEKFNEYKSENQGEAS